jgi:hypothetical protein
MIKWFIYNVFLSADMSNLFSRLVIEEIVIKTHLHIVQTKLHSKIKSLTIVYDDN